MYLFIFFGCISLSIGLWYPIRNYIEFKQPILYIMDPHNSDLYVGNYTLWQRFIPFSNEMNQMYCDLNLPVRDVNSSNNLNEFTKKYYGKKRKLNEYLPY